MGSTVVVGIAGGSGSGKTTLARAVAQRFEAGQVQLLYLDAYYRDRKGTPRDERGRINYDHPDAFDEELLVGHLEDLKAGRAIEQPVYDYGRHERGEATVRVEAARVVVLEGILVLALEAVRTHLDLKLFVDTAVDVRLARRIRRDVAERGRSVDSVVEQYMSSVRPMHARFIEPTRHHADLIVPGEVANGKAAALIRAWIERLLLD